jgi:hypothetical protein
LSIDFYVAIPAAQWPTAAAVQQCMVERAYPVQLKRFPAYDPTRSVSDGALVVLDGMTEAYLEGEISSPRLSASEVGMINERIAASSGDFRVRDDDALMSIRARSPAEARAASYVVASLIVCFHGYGFEPQGNTHGRDDFAGSLIAGADALKGL